MVGEGGARPREVGTRVLTHPIGAAAVLLGCYLLLSLFLNPGGYLGTDTGTKVHTLEVMVRDGTFVPDIGYWAEDMDPSGSLHPIYQTVRQDDGSWVGVTTLPMLEAAQPLYRFGGYRAALLLPMLGGVAAAAAGRSMSRRIAGGEGWTSFWALGLASPITVYALDFWEHSIGVACVLGATAILTGVSVRRLPPWVGVFVGLVLGAGAVMRQEVLVYTAVLLLAFCVSLLVERRRLGPSLVLGLTSLAGFAVSWAANALLEDAVQGTSRAERSTGVASSVAGGAASGTGGWQVADRAREGLQTSLGLVSGEPIGSALLGAGVVLAVLLAARAERSGDRRFTMFALGAAGVAYVASAIGGLGFVPGLFVAFPAAIGGLLCWPAASREGRLLIGCALGALPIVYAFQYTGGAAPQWGGRYTLPSALLLGIVAISVLRPRLPRVRTGLIALSALVTILGVAWLVERSHAVSRFFDEVVAEAEPVLIARQAFLLREGGAVSVDRQWLSPASQAEFERAVDIARASDVQRFSVLEWDGEAPPVGALPDDVREVSRTELRFVDTLVGLVAYEFTD